MGMEDVLKDYNAYREKTLSSLKNATRLTHQITSEDLPFYRVIDSNVATSLDTQSSRVLSLANNLCRSFASNSGLKRPRIKNSTDSVDDNWKKIVDVIDTLLEKTDASLDEFSGRIKRLPKESEFDKKQATASLSVLGKRKPEDFPSTHNKRPSKIRKPQLEFEVPPNNFDPTPFKPLLRSKPYARLPLGATVRLLDDNTYSHPYETEIKAAKYPSTLYDISDPSQPAPLESDRLTFVDTIEGVKSMVNQLKKANEIAVDLEHHDVHSYQGIVCLMQISTRDRDFIVDTLKPWRLELQMLNRIFANPSIIKVFHGSNSDIIWLQRDLGIYVVNLFDTYHAAVVLGYRQRSLKYLLEKFEDFQAEKQYQLADWRLRPLLPGMMEYARSDTHYLLHIYDCMRNDLVRRSKDTEGQHLVDYVLERSKEEALQRFQRTNFDPVTGKGPGGWFDMLLRSSVLLSKEQFAVFKAVHQWRDHIARTEDEGAPLVLARHALFRIAQTMPLDAVSLLHTAAPVSHVIRGRALELVEVIKQAKLAGANGPEMRDVLHPVEHEVTSEEVAQEGDLTTEATNGAESATTRPVVTIDATVDKATESQFWGPHHHLPPKTASHNKNTVAAAAQALEIAIPVPCGPRSS